MSSLRSSIETSCRSKTKARSRPFDDAIAAGALLLLALSALTAAVLAVAPSMDLEEGRRYRLRPAALTDLENIWSYTAARWPVAQADKYAWPRIAMRGFVEDNRQTP